MKQIHNRRSIADEVYFTSITDKKFKINSITVNFITEMSHNAAENAVLDRMLTKCCEKYDTMAKLNRRLSELYSAGLNYNVFAYDDFQVCSLSINVLDNRYALEGEDILRETVDILLGCIFAPYLENGAFPEQSLDIEKRNQIDDNDSEINDKTRYAHFRALETGYKGEPASLRWGGTNEEVEAVSTVSVMKAYRRMISETRVEIVCVGESDFDGLDKVFADAFSKVERHVKPIPGSKPSPLKSEIARVTENLDIEQSKLVMLFKTPLLKPYPFLVMRALYGGTESSKLFMNVREKMSLCYYCFATMMFAKGAITVECGVAHENIEKTEKECINQLDEIVKGNFTDDELEKVKLYIINTVRSSEDTVSGISGKCLTAILTPGFDVDIEEKVRGINSVTREDVIETAASFRLDTVYTLIPGEKEADE